MASLARILALPLVVLVLLAPAAPPARAADYGYLWSLEFDFEHDFNGTLTIEVGPWENGDLVSVDATSKEVVPCRRIGAVYLDGGDAVFDGGYLSCTMDLAAIVFRNHGLKIGPLDSYGSLLMATRLSSGAPVVAPIVSHPDADYTIDFTQSTSVTMSQDLNNGIGASQATFLNVIGANWHTYEMLYGCAPGGGPCDALFEADGLAQIMPTAGTRAHFQTDKTEFLIGGDGATTFSGRMAALLIDPGNTMP